MNANVQVAIALTVLAFFVIRSMARTALRLDDAEAATAAVRAAVNAPAVVTPRPPG